MPLFPAFPGSLSSLSVQGSFSYCLPVCTSPAPWAGQGTYKLVSNRKKDAGGQVVDFSSDMTDPLGRAGDVPLTIHQVRCGPDPDSDPDPNPDPDPDPTDHEPPREVY